MAVPDFQRLMLPVLTLAADGQVHTLADAAEHVARAFQLSAADLTEQIPSGQPRLNNRLGWTTTYLRKAQLLRAAGPGRFQITDRGLEVLATRPTTLDVAYLESRFPEMAEFRKRQTSSPGGDDRPAEVIDGKATAGLCVD